MSQIKPVFEGGVIAAGNASQFSDGAGAVVVMSAKPRRKSGLKPLGDSAASRSPAANRTKWASVLCSRCRSSCKSGIKISDIDIWELNEAFAVQVIYCRDKLGIPDDKLNVNGGAIAVGHPTACRAHA